MAPSKQKPLCKLLSAGNIDAFNRDIGPSKAADLVDADLRGLDLRRANLKQADLRGAYLRHTDLRGLDLSEANLDGASIRQAQISGVLFPRNLTADEIRLSAEFGTRLRSKRIEPKK